jgi:hypothetical protein
MATKKKPEKKPAVDERKLEQWKKKGESLAKKKDGNQWDIGDWILAGEKTFGKKRAYDAAQKATGMKRATLYLFKDTAECFPISTRVKNLYFGHYRLVANNDYTKQQRKELLQEAKGESVASFAAILRDRKKKLADRAERRSDADVAAAKVMEACDAFLRNHNVEKLLNEPPTSDVRTELLERLKNAVSELNNKIEMLAAVWQEEDEADAAFLSSNERTIAVGAGK